MLGGTDTAPITLIEGDAWVQRTLNVVPPARNRGPVRLEIQTRCDTLLARLQRAIDSAPEGDRPPLRDRKEKAANALNGAMTANAFLSDTVSPGNFVRAVRTVDTVLARVAEIATEAEGLAQVAETRGADRERLKRAFAEQQQVMQAQSGRALGGGSPGKDETDARDAENAMRDAIGSTAFTSNLATDTEWGQAKLAAETALAKWQQASGGLEGRGDEGEVRAAAQAIANERKALEGLKTHKAFGTAARALDRTLEQAAQTLENATTGKAAAAQTAQRAAADAKVSRLRIEAAVNVFDPLFEKVLQAATAADPTPKKLLQEAFQNAAKESATALKQNEDGTGALRQVEALLNSTQELTQLAGALRKRGETLGEAAAKAGLSQDQQDAVGDVTALREALKDIAQDRLDALTDQLGKAERALAEAVKAREAYRVIDTKLRQTAQGFAASKALGIDGRALFVGALDAAEKARATKHEDGRARLEALETNAEAFGAFCTTIAGFDEPLKVAGVRERVASGLDGLDARGALAAPDTIPALRDAAAQLANPLRAWAAYLAVKMDATAVGQVEEAKGLYDAKVLAAEEAAKAGEVQKAGELGAALKLWLDGVTQFVKLGEQPREDASKVTGDKAITDMLAQAVEVFDQARKDLDFGAAGHQLVLLKGLVQPATALEAARKAAAEALPDIVGTGAESKRVDDGKKDEELKKKLEDALLDLKPDAKLLGERRQALVQLLQQIKDVGNTRANAVKQEIGGNPLNQQKANAIFGDPESKKLALQIHAWLGKAPMQAMLATIGDGNGGPAALTKAVKELGGLGKDTLAMLKTQLADAGHIGKLCEPDGSVTFLKDLVGKFTGEEAKLGGLMQTGARGSVDRFKAMVDGKADRAKSIADTFDMKKLDALVQGCGGAATTKALFGLAEANGDVSFVKKLADKFPGAEAKLGGLMKNGVGDDTERFKAMVDGKEDRAKAISDKFNAELPKLRSLLQTGFSDNNATIKGVFDNGSVDQIKDLSDGFPVRAQLQGMTNAMTGAKAGEKIKKIAATNFGGDWKKLKQPFYDTLVNAPDGNRLMRDADQFDKSGNIISMPGNMGHFQSVNIGHISERHTPENFDFNDIKGNNTQFTPTARQDLDTTIQEAITLVNGWQPGPPYPDSPATWNNNMGKWYAPFSVTANGVNLLVGVRTWWNGADWDYEVPQIYPTSGDNYSGAQMRKLKQAMNR